MVRFVTICIACIAVAWPGKATAQETRLSTDETVTIAAFIRRALIEAPTDFVRLRGHKNADWQYVSTVSFGAAFDHCNVDLDDDTNKWGLECTSTMRTISTEDLSAGVERAVNEGLPSGFAFSRGSGDSEPDMTWTGPNGISVWVIVTLDGGKVIYVITLDHG
jgi:hypothetical protein